MRVAMLGLGRMGLPMARRLVDGGHDVVGFDRARDRLAAFLEYGGRIANCPAEAVSGTDAVITMLPDEQVVAAVLFDADGAASHIPEGALLLEMSTSDAAFVHQCAARLSPAGIRVMDAPVARGVAEAARGELIVLAAGEADDVAAAMPVLRCFARQEDVLHVGPRGSGIRLKLINNYLSMLNMVVAAEGLTFAALAGIERDTALRLFSATPAGKGQLLTNYPRKVLSGDISPDFPLRLGLKDMNVALHLGAEVGAPLFLGAAARQAYSLAANWGRAEQDCTAMLHLMADLAHCDNVAP